MTSNNGLDFEINLYLSQVGEEICNQSVTDTALLYLRHLPEIPEDFFSLAPFDIMMSFLRQPEKFNFRAFRSNCGLGAVERERALLNIALNFVKADMESRLPSICKLLGELRLAYIADDVESIMQEILGLSASEFDSLNRLNLNLKLLLANSRYIAKMPDCRQWRGGEPIHFVIGHLGLTDAENVTVPKSKYEPRPNSVKHFVWSTKIFGGYSPRGWKARLNMVRKRKRARASGGNSTDNNTPKPKSKKKRLNNNQAQVCA